jgi:hypothetical protein
VSRYDTARLDRGVTAWRRDATDAGGALRRIGGGTLRSARRRDRRRSYWRQRSCRRAAAVTPGEAAGDDVWAFQPANTSYHNIGRSGGDGAAATSSLICAQKLRQQKAVWTRLPPRTLTTSIPRMIGDRPPEDVLIYRGRHYSSSTARGDIRGGHPPSGCASQLITARR